MPLVLLFFIISFVVANDEPSHIQNSTSYLCNFTEKPGEIECEVGPGNWKSYENREEQVLDIKDPEFWLDLFVVIGLTCTAGMMSGLTIGLMGLDKTQLEILRKSGTPSQRQQAKRILPLINRHHLLLVTLLLMNALANEALPIFLEHLVRPVYAVICGVTLLLIFGEIIPMALFTRWGLAMGSSLSFIFFISPMNLKELVSSGLSWIIIAACFIIAWPVSKLLDCLLGAHESIKLFKRTELKELMNLHGSFSSHKRDDEALGTDEITIIKGALDLRQKTVIHIGTSLKKTFMLNITDKIDPQTIQKIRESGHSRIPIYREVRDQVVGMILVRSLLLLDRKTATPISQLNIQRLPNVAANLPLYDMLNIFQTGRSHMAIIVDQNDQITPLGIITLEDVIEELLQEEIMDETDIRTPRVITNESDDSGVQSIVSTDDDDTSFESPLQKEIPLFKKPYSQTKPYDATFQQGAVMTAIEEAFTADGDLRINLDSNSSTSESEENLLHEKK